ncbi:hypothetical protein DFJ73DRAFT_867089, partial [Zopfochytrium polystomum]
MGLFFRWIWGGVGGFFLFCSRPLPLFSALSRLYLSLSLSLSLSRARGEVNLFGNPPFFCCFFRFHHTNHLLVHPSPLPFPVLLFRCSLSVLPPDRPVSATDTLVRYFTVLLCLYL